ncbi:MAG TPA: DNA mismatch repair protein MutS [Firmicutes bacterium]|jgi:DNA mismatch repair protein MutS|nr:DNA mismatch repair protein MutS [Bacillota bacterium]
MKMSEVDVSMLSPMMKEYYKTKSEYMDVLLFYRLGDFYEMFFEDAITASHELELTLTGKNAGLKERVPMCGVPHHAVNVYLEKLIDKGYKVAICEQVEDPKLAKGIVKREVTEIVSKGTLTNTDCLDENDYNFIASITDYNYIYALSYLDLLSGKVFATFVSKSSDKLISEIVSLGIKEVVVTSDFDNSITKVLKNNYNIYVSIYDKDYSNINRSKVSNLADAKLEDNTLKLISYITFNQKKEINHLMKPVIVNSKDYLSLNRECIRNLELVETIRNKDKMYSLLWFLDKTKTSMGSRMLKEFILKPVVSESEINKRHDLIDLFKKEFMSISELRDFLYQIYDLERLVGKVSINTLNGRDLLQLKSSLGVLPDINLILENIGLEKVETFSELYDLLDKSIDLDAPVTIKEGGLIKDGFNKELDELKSIRKNGKDFISKFESEERERTGIKNLKVGYNKVFGYYIEVSKGQKDNIKEEFGYVRKQTISNSERYITNSLKEKEDMILNAEDKIKDMEYNIFLSIKSEVSKYIGNLQKVSDYIAYLDVMQSLTKVSEENNFVRPIINHEHNINIVDAKHPVVMKVIKDDYVSNNIVMDEYTNILMITGPNMSGKSTYMRTLAIIVILNQIGCFVPASSCELPIFDKIFTRIGASDDLVGGESTFMVEMKESAYALKNATENSLILFDELGRGTSTYDGMSLAGSIIEYVNKYLKCKTMFSTHYHELTKMAEYTPSIKNVHVSINETDGKVVFLHKVMDGAVDKSYGINVAKLAGLPDEVIEGAGKLLETYESTSKTEKKHIKQFELDLETPNKDPLREFLRNINPLEVTPMEALKLLDEMKKIK